MNKLSRRSFLGSTSVAVLAGTAYASVSRSVKLAIGPTVTTFQVRNWGAATSPGFLRGCFLFRKGDVPAGSSVTVTNGAAPVDVQCDQFSTWSDGSLKLCVFQLRDAPYAPFETRQYFTTVAFGVPFNNAGTRSLADIAASHDFNVSFANTTKFDGTATTAYGSGSFVADFNQLAATATRITKVHSGAVCEGWVAWGLAVDKATGVADQHLKTYWHVDVWKNPDGSIADFEYAAVVAQDWWSVPGKYRLNYDATLNDGANTVQTYAAVQHPYRSHWITCQMQADNNHGRRFWANKTPTLIYMPDKAYWVSTNLVPPLNPAIVPAPGASPHTQNYAPCKNINVVAFVDQTGGSNGRGIFMDSDCWAFLSQDPFNVKCARATALSGLGVPYHYRSNRTRVRPGDGGLSDTASTIVACAMLPDPPNTYDFTAQGMPVAVEPYTHGGAAVEDGYVLPLGGNGVWTPSNDSSHASNYCFFMYLQEGERHFLDAEMDLATNLIHQQGGTPYQGRPGLLCYDIPTYQKALNIPSTVYSGIAGLRAGANQRRVAWALTILASAAAIVPDADVQAQFLRTLTRHQGKYLAASMQYLPASQIAAGQYRSTSGYISPWMNSFIVLGAYHMAFVTEDANALAVGDWIANSTVGTWTTHVYRTVAYRGLCLPNPAGWAPGTNEFFPPTLARGGGQCCSISATTNRLTIVSLNHFAWFVNGDPINVLNVDGGVNPWPVPKELALGTTYYVANVSGRDVGASFQLSTTPDGQNLVTFNSDYKAAWFVAYQAAQDLFTVSQNPPYQCDPDSYAPIARAALVAAHRSGNASATSTLVANAQTFLSKTDAQNRSYYGWSYST